MATMVEDVFAALRRGEDPFRIETLWRRVYGSRLHAAARHVADGRALGPRDGLAGTSSARRSASRSTSCSAAGCTSGCAPTPISIRRTARTRPLYHDAERSAERAAEYVEQGFTAVKFDPAGAYSAFDPRQPSLEALDSVGKVRAAAARGGRHQGRPAVRHAWPVYRLGRHPAGQAARAVRAAVVRGADAAGNAGGDGPGGARHLHPHRHRRAADAPNTSSPACSQHRRRLDPADGARPRRRHAGGQEDRRHGRGALRPDGAAPLLRPGRRRRQHSASPPASRTS